MVAPWHANLATQLLTREQGGAQVPPGHDSFAGRLRVTHRLQAHGGVLAWPL